MKKSEPSFGWASDLGDTKTGMDAEKKVSRVLRKRKLPRSPKGKERRRSGGSKGRQKPEKAPRSIKEWGKTEQEKKIIMPNSMTNFFEIMGLAEKQLDGFATQEHEMGAGAK